MALNVCPVMVMDDLGNCGLRDSESNGNLLAGHAGSVQISNAWNVGLSKFGAPGHRAAHVRYLFKDAVGMKFVLALRDPDMST